ncbi:glycosyltransferase family 2 protein [Companilactobacillus sp. DQM5]|uniref:glycosyltransferase family 2 protein n=1 Tax=Companilactobacillus sp. DQM5 TaxID=3463359 RepID=UPI004058BD29
MENSYKITVVMPVYNAEQYLNRALTSFVNQTFKNFQLIIVDDNSTDGSVKICEDFLTTNKNFKLIKHKENLGVSAARNTGIKGADSEFITFVDCDDWVDKEYLEFFIDSFKRHDVDMVSCGFMIETDKTSKSKGIFKNTGSITDRNDMLKRIISVNGTVMGYTWNKAYKLKKIIDNHLEFSTDVNLMEDAIFNVQYVSATNSFYYCTDPLYHYYQRKNSASHNYFDWDNIKDVGIANYRIHKQIIQNIGEQIDIDNKEK